MKRGFRMADIWWPADTAEALAKGLVTEHEDGKLAVSAEDGAGRIVLHQLRRRIAVCYPLLIRDAAQEGAWEYIWQTQVFSLLACPLRWRPAVELLLQVAEHLEPREGATPIQASGGSCCQVSQGTHGTAGCKAPQTQPHSHSITMGTSRWRLTFVHVSGEPRRRHCRR